MNNNLPQQVIPNDGRQVYRFPLKTYGGARAPGVVAKLKQPGNNYQLVTNLELQVPPNPGAQHQTDVRMSRDKNLARDWKVRGQIGLATGQPTAVTFKGMAEAADHNNRYYLIWTSAPGPALIEQAPAAAAAGNPTSLFAFNVDQLLLTKVNDLTKITTLDEVKEAQKLQASSAAVKLANTMASQYQTEDDRAKSEKDGSKGKKGGGKADGGDAGDKKLKASRGPQVISARDGETAQDDGEWGHFDDDEGVGDEMFDTFDSTGDWKKQKRRKNNTDDVEKYADSDNDSEDERLVSEQVLFAHGLVDLKDKKKNEDDFMMLDETMQEGSEDDNNNTTTTTTTTTTAQPRGANKRNIDQMQPDAIVDVNSRKKGRR